MGKRREKTERKAKKIFLQRCEERKFLKGLKLKWRDMFFVICFTLGGYFAAMYFIGDGAYNYTDEAYERLQIAIGTSMTEDFGMDEKALRKQVNEYYSAYKDGKSTIVAKETIGHFVAEVTVELTDEMSARMKEGAIEKADVPEEYLTEDLSEESTKTYYVIPCSRNYNSRADYLRMHYIEVALWMLAGAFLYVVLFKLLLNCILFAGAKGFIKIFEMRERKSNANGIALSE